jgi:hypothetical protein
MRTYFRLPIDAYFPGRNMSFSKPEISFRTSLEQRVGTLERELRYTTAEHKDLWAQVGRIQIDVVRIYNLIQYDTGPHKFAFSPLERLSSVEGALAVLSTKLEALK